MQQSREHDYDTKVRCREAPIPWNSTMRYAVIFFCFFLHCKREKRLINMRSLRTIFMCILFEALLLSPLLAVPKKSNNWAVLVCTSKYFFNYRHLSNVLAVYRVIKQSGIPDSQIILMNALDVQCDSRNRYPGHMYDTDEAVPFMQGDLYATHQTKDHTRTVPASLCDENLEMDYTVSLVITTMDSTAACHYIKTHLSPLHFPALPSIAITLHRARTLTCSP
jgi:hypothetical protein